MAIMVYNKMYSYIEIKQLGSVVGAILQKVYGLSKKRLAALQKLQLGCSAFELPKLRFRARAF